MLKNKGGLVPTVVLLVICSLTSALLSWTNIATAETIAMKEAEKDDQARKTILTEATEFKEVPLEEFLKRYPDFSEENTKASDMSNLVSIYKGLAGDKVIGYIIQGTYRGYGGNVPSMVGVLKDKTISKVTVLTNEETPGLGKKVEDEAFLKQFEKASIEKPFVIGDSNEDEVKVDTVSGATYSSRAVQRSVDLAMKIAKQIGEEDL